MAIYMITREHETETGNGPLYDEYIDPEFGYFTSRVQAEEKLGELQRGEKEAHERRWREGPYAQWRSRKDQYDQTLANNRILKENGGTLLQLPHVYPEPVMKEWTFAMSAYNVTTIDPAEGASS